MKRFSPLSLAPVALICSSCNAQTPQTTVPQVQLVQAPAPDAPTNSTPLVGKIVVRPDMLTNEVARGDAFQLFDEPETVGTPKIAPKTAWNEGYQKIYYPLSAFIDLGAEYQISDILVYDGSGTGDFRVEGGKPFEWKPLFSDPLASYQKWNRHSVDTRTRYLHFTLPEPGTRVPEVAIYGKALGPVQTAKVPAAKPHILPTMDEFIGTNAFIDDPVDKMKAVGFVREYHSWSWDAGDGSAKAPAFPNNLVAFNPSYAAGGNGWFFDDYYAKLKAEGITVCPAIQGSVKWLTSENSHTPVGKGQDASDPASYKAHADHMFQFVARYGSQKVADAKLKLAPNQPRKSGLGLLSYFENANEPDAWWHGREGYSTPYELAARSSADYDGHKKTLGDTFGIKNADPKAQLVLGGLAGLRLDYIKAMKAWADYKRGGDFPADVLNLHHYSNDLGDQGQSKMGITPEADKLKERMQEVVDYRDRYLPGKPLWLTEFGYDTNPASVQRASAIGATSAEEVQARWLVRSYLAIAAAGVDKAAQYMLRDVDPNDTTKYSTSGLVTQKGEWKPKTSWFYTYTLKNRLAGMRFAGEVSSGNPKVLIYKFKSDKGNGAYVLWCPTAENASVEFQLKNLAPAKAATLVELQNGEVSGKASPLKLNGGEVSLTVNESPKIVLVDSMPLK